MDNKNAEEMDYTVEGQCIRLWRTEGISTTGLGAVPVTLWPRIWLPFALDLRTQVNVKIMDRSVWKRVFHR